MKKPKLTQLQKHAKLRDLSLHVVVNLEVQRDALKTLFGRIDNGKPVQIAQVMDEAITMIAVLAAELRPRVK